MQLDIQPEIEAQLAAEAQACGLALNLYVVEKLREPRLLPVASQPFIAEAIENLRALRKGTSLSGSEIKELITAGRKY